MPMRAYCSGCNTTLYDGLELESPTEIIQRYNGVCPKCSKQLKFEPEKVRIPTTTEEDSLKYLKKIKKAPNPLRFFKETLSATNAAETTTRTIPDDQKTWYTREDDKK